MNCPICCNEYRLEDISTNIEKCKECQNLFHGSCMNRVPKRANANKPECPLCRKMYIAQPLSKLERLDVKSDMELFKCKLCGCISQKQHLFWCLFENILTMESDKEEERIR